MGPPEDEIGTVIVAPSGQLSIVGYHSNASYEYKEVDLVVVIWHLSCSKRYPVGSFLVVRACIDCDSNLCTDGADMLVTPTPK